MIIGDYLANSVQSAVTIPQYIRDLFSHYCLAQTTPRVVGIEKIYDEMLPELKVYFFEEAVGSGDIDETPGISEFKVAALFPNAENISI